MKKLTLILIAILFAPLLPARAQLSQFGQPTYLQCPTNSGVIATTVFYVSVPAITLSITATNPATIITNTIFNGLNVGGSNLVPATVFIYNAAIHGTNFTTNFNAYSVIVTNYTFGQAAPQSGGTNTAYIK